MKAARMAHTAPARHGAFQPIQLGVVARKPGRSQNCRRSSRGDQVQADLLAMVARDDQSDRTGSVGHPGDGLAIEVEDGSGRGESLDRETGFPCK